MSHVSCFWATSPLGEFNKVDGMVAEIVVGVESQVPVHGVGIEDQTVGLWRTDNYGGARNKGGRITVVLHTRTF